MNQAWSRSRSSMREAEYFSPLSEKTWAVPVLPPLTYGAFAKALALVPSRFTPSSTRLPGVITAIVLISVDVDSIPEVAQQIADLDGVTEVYSVAGDADLIALVRVRQHDELADVIADRLNKVPGVTGTATHIAFRTYSKHDLEAAFSLGIES